MHYYERNIGDYYRKAGRLNILQHGVYNLLIDACYDRERFPTQEEAIDWVWAETEEEIEAVKFVLKKFFQLNEDGVFVQTHIEEDLIRFKEFHLKQSENGKKGGRPKKQSNSDDSGNNGFENESQENPNETQNNPEKANESQTKPKPTNHLTNEPSNQIKNIRPPDGEPETAKNQKFKNEVQEIFEFWKFTLGKSNTVILSEARKSKILARLRQGYTVDNLKLAITNCSKSDYHIQGGYTDLELICRNEQKVDYFIAMSQQIQAPQVQAQLESPPVNPADFYEIRGRW